MVQVGDVVVCHDNSYNYEQKSGKWFDLYNHSRSGRTVVVAVDCVLPTTGSHSLSDTKIDPNDCIVCLDGATYVYTRASFLSKSSKDNFTEPVKEDEMNGLLKERALARTRDFIIKEPIRRMVEALQRFEEESLDSVKNRSLSGLFNTKAEMIRSIVGLIPVGSMSCPYCACFLHSGRLLGCADCNYGKKHGMCGKEHSNYFELMTAFRKFNEELVKYRM
jgi:hypothetical protein